MPNLIASAGTGGAGLRDMPLLSAAPVRVLACEPMRQPVVQGCGPVDRPLGRRERIPLGTPSVEDGVIAWAVVRRVHHRYRVARALVTPTRVVQGEVAGPSSWRIAGIAPKRRSVDNHPK